MQYNFNLILLIFLAYKTNTFKQDMLHALTSNSKFQFNLIVTGPATET